MEPSNNDPIVETLYKLIQAKRPRLSVLLFDCCNAPVDIVTHQHRQASGLMLEAYRKLFVEQTGSVVLCSTRPPQFSYVDVSGQGSVFTIAFNEALDEALTTAKQVPISWKHVLQRTQTRLQRYLRQLGSRYAQVHETAQQPIAHLLPQYQTLPAFADYPPQEAEQAITTSGNDALHVILTTNRGRLTPVFRQGDTLQLALTVSHPCYVRLIDILPDGTPTLLVDNLWVDEVGSSVKVQGRTLICDAPFGTEQLRAFASERPFVALTIQEEDGYAVITDSLQIIQGGATNHKVAKDSVTLKTGKAAILKK